MQQQPKSGHPAFLGSAFKRRVAAGYWTSYGDGCTADSIRCKILTFTKDLFARSSCPTHVLLHVYQGQWVGRSCRSHASCVLICACLSLW